MNGGRPDVQLDRIPACLRERPQWVVWRYVTRDGRATKMPHDARSGREADTTDPPTWSTFEEAVTAWRANGRWSGIGFVFAADDPYCGVDLDDCRDPGTGALAPWAAEVVARLDSYCEVSPSREGVKLFLAGTKPGARCRRAFADGEVEVYDHARFFTVTGARLDRVSADVEPRQAALDWLYDLVFGAAAAAADPPAPPANPDAEGEAAPEGPADAAPPVPEGPAGEDAPPPPASGTGLTDEQILGKATRSRRSGAKFAALWAGRWNDHFNSASEADSSVVFTLAFYTKDPTQIDRLFRTSKLMRPKWDERHGARTYGGMTIDKALEKVTAQWRPKAGRAKPPPGPPAPATPPADPGLPSIVIDDVQLHELTRQAVDALVAANEPPVVFRRGGGLCRVVADETGAPAIDAYDKVRMRGRLTQVANFYATAQVDRQPVLVAVNPPVPLAENLVTLGDWPFPPLLGIAHAPILRDDGTVCDRPGYDRQSGLLYRPAPGLRVPPIPDRPTTGRVRAAVAELDALVADFPFADRASRANALSILFSLLMRPVIRGHVPLAVVGAPVQGTGKTLLVTALAGVAVGRVSSESIPAKQNDDEWRKKITTVLRGAAPFVLLDNVPDNTTIDAPALAAALTSDEWSDRVLGGNDWARVASRAVWAATGNNLRVAGDMPRRCYTVTLDANAERPWERGGFGIPDLERYAERNRGRLLAAAFTVVRGWYAAGRPAAAAGGPVIGSFQEWADTLGGVLAFAGVEGFLANLNQTRAVQDEDTQQWAAFFDAWWARLGGRAVTVDAVHRQLLVSGGGGGGGEDAVALPEPLLVHRDKGDGSLKRSLGRHLSRLAGRVFAGRKLCSPGDDAHTKVRLWCLAPLDNPANPALPNDNPAANPAPGGLRWE